MEGPSFTGWVLWRKALFHPYRRNRYCHGGYQPADTCGGVGIRKSGIKTIFLLPSSVPEVIGIDLKALAQELSPQFPDTRLIPLTAGGFDVCGHRGVEFTLLELCKTLPKEVHQTGLPSFNIIGSCADMFRYHADAAEIARMASGALGMEHLCTMTSGTSISQLETLGAAHLNFVIRREGEAAAKYLQERFGTPYLTARPMESREPLTGWRMRQPYAAGRRTNRLSAGKKKMHWSKLRQCRRYWPASSVSTEKIISWFLPDMPM